MRVTYSAVYNITAFSGLGIVKIDYDIDDYVYIDYFTDNGKKGKITRHKVYNDKNDRLYIRKFNQKYYLDEFMRVE